MFAGHLAVALAAKRAEPEAPLGVLVAASFGLDLLWLVLLLVGLESVTVEPGATVYTPLSFDSYPWSHSLALAVFWGLLALLAVRWLGTGTRVANLTGVVVVSHWLLDWITHRPDLPLWPGGPLAGLGLWDSVAGTILIEGSFVVAAVLLYRKVSQARDGLGRIGLASLIALVTIVWLAGPFSPPPPGQAAIAVVALALWILPFWAWRIEAHRERK